MEPINPQADYHSMSYYPNVTTVKNQTETAKQTNTYYKNSNEYQQQKIHAEDQNNMQYPEEKEKEVDVIQPAFSNYKAIQSSDQLDQPLIYPSVIVQEPVSHQIKPPQNQPQGYIPPNQLQINNNMQLQYIPEQLSNKMEQQNPGGFQQPQVMNLNQNYQNQPGAPVMYQGPPMGSYIGAQMQQPYSNQGQISYMQSVLPTNPQLQVNNSVMALKNIPNAMIGKDLIFGVKEPPDSKVKSAMKRIADIDDMKVQKVNSADIKISQIKVQWSQSKTAELITGIKFFYNHTLSGSPIEGGLFLGTDLPSSQAFISLKQNEFLVAIEGNVSNHIHRIMFFTNFNRSWTFGKAEKNPMKVSAPPGCHLVFTHGGIGRAINYLSFNVTKIPDSIPELIIMNAPTQQELLEELKKQVEKAKSVNHGQAFQSQPRPATASKYPEKSVIQQNLSNNKPNENPSNQNKLQSQMQPVNVFPSNMQPYGVPFYGPPQMYPPMYMQHPQSNLVPMGPGYMQQFQGRPGVPMQVGMMPPNSQIMMMPPNQSNFVHPNQMYNSIIPPIQNPNVMNSVPPMMMQQPQPQPPKQNEIFMTKRIGNISGQAFDDYENIMKKSSNASPIIFAIRIWHDSTYLHGIEVDYKDAKTNCILLRSKHFGTAYNEENENLTYEQISFKPGDYITEIKAYMSGDLLTMMQIKSKNEEILEAGIQSGTEIQNIIPQGAKCLAIAGGTKSHLQCIYLIYQLEN